MVKHRKARKGGPLLWQLKLRLKRMKRRLDADLSAMEAKLAATEASSLNSRELLAQCPDGRKALRDLGLEPLLQDVEGE